jgi:serine protease Do
MKNYRLLFVAIVLSTLPTTVSGDETTKPSDLTKSSTPASLETLVERLRKSVAVITFVGRDGAQQGLGSGFVISPDGLIATNMHVLGDARPVKVKLADGKEHAVTSVHASDRPLDLAVVKIEATGLPALELGDSDSLKQGQAVLAIGNPLGLDYSAVTGIVSATREVEGRQMIQLAIPIEPGNSGGPLFDMEGRVHGLLTMKSLLTANLGFAVPINSLKPLLAKPNPIPMSRWLTIGTLPERDWIVPLGGAWRRRGAIIAAEEGGAGFGARSLCLSQQEVPERPYDVAVTVKLDDESGAAGLVFCSDGKDRHYGFYPSAGKLRLTRFDGPDVFSWQVLHDRPSRHYRTGDWNTLRVHLEDGKIQCFVNEQLVIESSDQEFKTGKAGLAKFRQTKAEFKDFRLGRDLASIAVPVELRERITRLTESVTLREELNEELMTTLAEKPDGSMQLLREQAKSLEQRSTELRGLADSVHEQRVTRELLAILSQPEDKIDLFHAGLLVSRLDNEELNVDAYRAELVRIAAELRSRLAECPDDEAKLAALKKYLFEENGFHGSRADYYNRSNSYLNEVLDDREGIPITLSAVYMELGRELGLNIVGIPLPGHFMVQHKPQAGEGQFIDVFDDAKLLSVDEVKAKVRETSGRDSVASDLEPTTKKAMIVRILHNLLGASGRKSDTAAALRYLNVILALEPELAESRWMRAVLAYQAGRYDIARTDVDWLQNNAPAGINQEQVQQLSDLLYD